MNVPFWVLQILRQLAGNDFATMLTFGGFAAIDSVAVRGFSVPMVETFFELRDRYEAGEELDEVDNAEEYVEEIGVNLVAIPRTLSMQTTNSTPRAAQNSRGNALLRASPSIADINRASEEPTSAGKNGIGSEEKKRSAAARIEEDAEEVHRLQTEIDVSIDSHEPI